MHIADFPTDLANANKAENTIYVYCGMFEGGPSWERDYLCRGRWHRVFRRGATRATER